MYLLSLNSFLKLGDFLNIIRDFDLFLFDLDGTLVDTEPLHFEAYRKVLADFGYELIWDFKTYLFYAGRGELFPVFRQLFPLWKKEQELEVMQAKRAWVELLLSKMPIQFCVGADLFVSKLIGEKKEICIVTNSSRFQLESIRSRLPLLKQIPVCVTRDDVERIKPDPEPYCKACSYFDIPKDKSIAFEDSEKGVESAQEAGLSVVYISSSTTKSEVQVPSFLHLMERA